MGNKKYWAEINLHMNGDKKPTFITVENLHAESLEQARELVNKMFEHLGGEDLIVCIDEERRGF